MSVPVERRYTTFRTWKWARKDIQEALNAQFGGDFAFNTAMDFTLPIAAELVRLARPKLDGADFDRLVWKVGRALL